MSGVTRPITRTVSAPGATLTYDVHRGDAPGPVLLLIGSPMGAAGFMTLAGHFTDRTVVTYDPRGVDRSPRDDPTTESTPQQHADDLHRVIGAIGRGPVDLFASSGGAVNALALVAEHPEDVRILVAHEPPLAAILPDRTAALAACRAVAEAYRRRGFGVGMARFIGVVSHQGPFSLDQAAAPDPDPAALGLPAVDDGRRTDPLLFQNMITCTHDEPAFDLLRAAPTRIVLAAGSESQGTLANRACFAAAGKLGQEETDVVRFPGGHGGFLGAEQGEPGDPGAFAARLREVLATA